MTASTPFVAQLRDARQVYGRTIALDGITLDIPAGATIGIIGPDGTGKSTMLGLIAGARKIQQGSVEVLGGDMRDAGHRREVCPLIAYMPQGLGKNLYPTLSVLENVDFFGRLFGQDKKERDVRIDDLLQSTDLENFRQRPAAKLSGGMKQKLGLCCSLIHDPDLLILDEPTTGVDPLARRQFWDLIARIHKRRPSMSVLVATAYMEEADNFDWLVAMNSGAILATGTSQELKERTGRKTLEDAFIQLLPESMRAGYQELTIPPRKQNAEVAIEAVGLTKRFGDFVAVDHVTLTVERGEIFGFLGSNGCGKSTTMKMLTGLLPATEGSARLFGSRVENNLETRRNVGYMSQAFSLYSELTVRQNLVLHAQLFHIPKAGIEQRVQEMVDRFELGSVVDQLPEDLPLGMKQRLSLAVAVIHRPSMLILDEPTSGVDPIARDSFWRLLISLSRTDGVTIFISTHFMNEAERCDRISLMHAGKVMATGKPAELVSQAGLPTLEATFIRYLEQADSTPGSPQTEGTPTIEVAADASSVQRRQHARFSLQRLFSYAYRETLELRRDSIRLTLALVGTALLMLIIGYGINMDVDNLSYAVLDRDQTSASEQYAENFSGSRYFIEKAPLQSYADLERRMRNGELSVAIEIPPNYGRDLLRGDTPSIGVWVDGAMPNRAQTVLGYVTGVHAGYLQDLAIHRLGVNPSSLYNLEVRYRYNPDVASLVAMVPAVIPLLLIFIPAMLTALGVVREKELGSILNLYTTPVTKLEFLLGKQLPYVGLGIINFIMMFLVAIFIFHVPMHGSFMTLLLGAILYVVAATGLGLLISTFMDSQIAAIFGTALGTIIPAVQFGGLLNPVSSLSGFGAFVGRIYPTAHFLTISRGVFSKGLNFSDLRMEFLALCLCTPLLILGSVLLLNKQGE